MSSFKALLEEKNDNEIIIRSKNQDRLSKKRQLGIRIGVAVLVIIGFLCLFAIGLSSLRAEKRTQHNSKYERNEFEFADEIENDAGANGNCQDLPADIISMARGVDITKLNVFPTTPAELRQGSGFVRQVVKLTCRFRFSKRLGNGMVVNLPDQVKPSAYEEASEHSSSNILTRSTERRSEELKKQMALDFGISIYFVGMFSMSLWYKDMRNSFISSNASFLESKTAHVVRKADFSSSSASGILAPHDDLHNLLATLPDNFSENAAGYMNVINQFGTHYFAYAKFGGFIQNSTQLNEDAQDSHNSRGLGLANKASIPITAGIKLNTGISASSLHNVESNKNALSNFTKTVIYGGNISLARNGNIEKWLETVVQSPKLFTGRLIPISSLIDDEAKAKALDKATQVHLGRAYVRDLEEQLETLKRIRIGTNLSEVNHMLTSLQNQAELILTDPIELAKLGEEVASLINSAPIPLTFGSRNNMQAYATIQVLKADLPKKCFLKIIPLKRLAYVRIRIWKSSRSINPSREFNTRTIHSNNPVWNEKFEEPLELDGVIEFCVWDKNVRLFDSTASGKQLACSDLTIRDIVKNELNDKAMLLDGLSYKGQPVSLSVRVTWYQRQIKSQ